MVEKICKQCRGIIANDAELWRTKVGQRRLSFCSKLHAQFYIEKVAKRKYTNENIRIGYMREWLKSSIQRIR